MNKKTVLKAAGLFVAGLAGGIGIMLSNDAYKAVNDALGNSTSNAIALTSSQSLAAQNSLMQTTEKQQTQVGQLIQNAEILKKQTDQMTLQEKVEAVQKSKEAQAQEQQQTEQMIQQQMIQQQMQQLLQQIQQMLQQMKESQVEAQRALTKS